MDEKKALQPIPKEDALRICEEIRKYYSGKWYTLTGLQCWGCKTFSKGDTRKMCYNSRPDYRGCNIINTRYDKEYK